MAAWQRRDFFQTGEERRRWCAVRWFAIFGKRLTAGLAAFCLLVFLAGCADPGGESAVSDESAPGAPASAALPEGMVRLCALNVGKADCLLLTAGRFHMLVDTGESQTAAQVTAWLTAQGVGRIHLLVLTHNDKDHIGGAAQLLRSLPVDRVIQADYDEESAAYFRYIQEAQACGLVPERLTEPLTLNEGGASIRLLPGARNDYTDDNDFSIMTEVTAGSRSLLLTGDADKERLREYLDTAAPRAFDVVKLPHHGDWNGATKAFLETFCGGQTIISTSAEEEPAKKLRAWLEDNKRKVWYTYDGTVTVLTDGTDLTITQKEESE